MLKGEGKQNVSKYKVLYLFTYVYCLFIITHNTKNNHNYSFMVKDINQLKESCWTTKNFHFIAIITIIHGSVNGLKPTRY